jgi:hypothetical protein
MPVSSREEERMAARRGWPLGEERMAARRGWPLGGADFGILVPQIFKKCKKTEAVGQNV